MKLTFSPIQRKVIGAVGTLLLAGVVALLGQRFFQEGSRGPAGTPDVGAESEGLALRSLTIYFGSGQSADLAAERHEVPASDEAAGDLAAAMSELAAGPLSALRRVLPDGTRLRHAFLTPDGVAYLDFSADVQSGFGGMPAEVLALRAIARTLAANFGQVRQFVLLVEGKPARTLGGHLDISRPLAVAEWK